MSPEPVIEKYIALPNNRTLAYTTSGNSSSTILVITFHGVFGVGFTSNKRQPKVLHAKDVHFVAPTLPGWGKTSCRPKGVPYYITLTQDITALIDHLYPDGLSSDFRLYICGGSYGSIPAQMLYGAAFDVFPYGKYIAGCMIFTPFSPFKYHKGYGKTLSMTNYVGLGPPTRWIPFNIMPRIAIRVYGLGRKLRDEGSAKEFAKELLFDKMTEEERQDFANWREKYGIEEGELEAWFASNMVKSVAETMEGFMECSDVMHSDWGFVPDQLDDEHNKHPILIVSGAVDDMVEEGMAKWLSETYKNAHWEKLGGGHICGIFNLDDVWAKLFSLTATVE